MKSYVQIVKIKARGNMEIKIDKKRFLLNNIRLNPEKPLRIICRCIKIDYSYGSKQLKQLKKEGYIRMRERKNFIYAELTKKGIEEINNIPLTIL